MRSKVVNKKQLLTVLLCCTGAVAAALSAGNDISFSAICGLICGVLGYLLYRLAQKRKFKKEADMFEIDMADYLTGVALLLSAGLNLWDSMRRALQGGDVRRPLYRDLTRMFDGIDNGKYESPVSAIEQLATERGSPAISMLAGVVVQNYKKGAGEIAELFRELSVTARNNRKYLCMKLADEATTLLLIPSAIILIALIALLLTPAMLTLLSI
ncbi:MAG: type II secretion system F family protein [Clostridia bacterium]|nr:type II secretion system F family protein [Clostridia bacterium]